MVSVENPDEGVKDVTTTEESATKESDWPNCLDSKDINYDPKIIQKRSTELVNEQAKEWSTDHLCSGISSDHQTIFNQVHIAIKLNNVI